MTMKVGKDFVQGTEKKVAYKDVYKNVNEWVNASKYIPIDYDLVMVRLSNGDLTYGWAQGSTWQGVLITPETRVIAWKKKLPAEIMG